MSSMSSIDGTKAALWLFQYDDPTPRRPESQAILLGSLAVQARAGEEGGGGKRHNLVRFWTPDLGWSAPHGWWKFGPSHASAAYALSPLPPMLQIRFHYRAGPSWLHKYLTAAQISPCIWHSTNRQRRVEMKLLRVVCFAAATPPMPMLPMYMPDPDPASMSSSSEPLAPLPARATGLASGNSAAMNQDLMQVSLVASDHETTTASSFMRIAESSSVAVQAAVEAEDWLVVDPALWDTVLDDAPRTASSAQEPQA